MSCKNWSNHMSCKNSLNRRCCKNCRCCMNCSCCMNHSFELGHSRCCTTACGSSVHGNAARGNAAHGNAALCMACSNCVELQRCWSASLQPTRTGSQDFASFFSFINQHAALNNWRLSTQNFPKHAFRLREPLQTPQYPIFPDRNLSNNQPIFSQMNRQSCQGNEILRNPLDFSGSIYTSNY